MIKAAKELGGGMQVLFRKKKVPWPIKVHGDQFTELQFEQSVKTGITKCSHALVTGGSEFILSVGKTESLRADQNIDNIVSGLHQFACIVIWCIATSNELNKHNRIQSVSLSTTKSIALPIFEQGNPEDEI